MRSIQKYKLAIEPTQSIELPFDAQILKVGLVNGEPYLWAMVDPTKKSIARSFRTYVEGKDLDQSTNESRFLGSVHLEKEDARLFIFEV